MSTYIKCSAPILRKSMYKFIHIKSGKRYTEDEIRAKADCYRRLVHFKQELEEEIKKLYDFLLKNNVEIYFVEDNEKVVTVCDPSDLLNLIVEIQPMCGNADIRKARKLAFKKSKK